MSHIAVGIDVGELGGKGLDLVALDGARHVVSQMSGASLDAITRAVLSDLRPAVVCIDSPSRWATPGSRRACEQQITRLGINLFTTPTADRATAFHQWMRDGFAVYDALASAYPRYQGSQVEGTAAEYFPHASAVALAGHIPPLRTKWAFRRSILEQNDVDPRALKSQDQVDAALGALTGLVALEARHSWLGSGVDMMLLPVRPLPARFPRATSSQSEPPGLPSSRPRPPSKLNPCECGCGALGPGRFRPGHDAKLYSRRLKEQREREAVPHPCPTCGEAMQFLTPFWICVRHEEPVHERFAP